MIELQATPAQPGPDGNRPQTRDNTVTLVLREAQAVGAGGRYNFLEGRAVPYDTWEDVGWFMESHAAGSFKGSTRGGTGRGLPLLLFHDNRSLPIGHAESWTHDGGGLDGVWRLSDIPAAQDAARSADRGDLRGMSVGFSPIRSKWELLGDDEWSPDLGPDHMDRVLRIESRLIEVSLTPTPAFAGAQIDQVRAGVYYTRAARLAGRPDLDVDRWRREAAALRSR